jgi:hypothetical protein
VGLISLNAKIMFTSVTITTNAGGLGGNGGNGQVGGIGGQQGNQGGMGACPGGIGGQGGRGGSGGGGLGGHSVGIAYQGNAPDPSGATIMVGMPGLGGQGGDMDATVNGAKGIACQTLDFANASSCVN